MEIRFFDEKARSDKTEKTVENIFKFAGQIMFNYYMLALKKDIRTIKTVYSVTMARK